MKNKNLKISNCALIKEKKKLLKEKKSLLKKNQDLKKEVEKYKPIVKNFTYSSEKLQMILSNQRTIFNKTGLGFKP